MTKEIPLGRHKVAVVDDDDYDRLSVKKWHCSHYGYAIRFVGRSVVWMHREIMDATHDVEVDHISRDRLDNRKNNLRLATHTENSRNKGIVKANTSGQPGVGFHKKSGKWRAYIRVNYKQMEKLCSSFEEAVIERRKMELLYFGEFAAAIYQEAS